MTDTLPILRWDRRVLPVPPHFRTSAFLRAMTFAFLFAISSFAIASAQESTPVATPSTMPTPSPSMPRLELTLDELNDSGISGTVTLYDAGENKTIVEFDVEGAGGNHPAHIHQGVCGDLDPEPYQNLENVDKEGKSSTVVDVSLDSLLDSDYAIDMHLAPDELGTLIACANIEGQPALPNATPEASPEATSEPGVGGTIATETPSNPGVAVTQTPAPGGNDGTGGATTEITGQGDKTTTTTTTPSLGDGTAAGTTSATSSQPTVPVGGDGTAGVSGKGEPVTTETLPQQAGVGSALIWPEGPALPTMLAMASAAILLGAGGWAIRRGEHQNSTTHSRWTRLGI